VFGVYGRARRDAQGGGEPSCRHVTAQRAPERPQRPFLKAFNPRLEAFARLDAGRSLEDSSELARWT
jgi:hypothetical protein